jgi:hypothetical protein
VYSVYFLSVNFSDVFAYRNGIEVNTKLRCNLYNFKKRNSLPMDQHILTSNRLTPLINLQDSAVDVNDGTVSNELGTCMKYRGKIGKLNILMWRQTVAITFPLYLMAKNLSQSS